MNYLKKAKNLCTFCPADDYSYISMINNPNHMDSTLFLKIKSYLNRDYDLLDTWKRKLVVITILFVFTSLILILFKPFGLVNFETQTRYLLIAKYIGYPLLIWTSVISLISLISTRSFTIIDSIGLLLLLTAISGFTTYYIWADYFNYSFFNWNIFIQFEIMAVSTVFIPLFIIVIIHSNYTLRQRLHESKHLNKVISKEKELKPETYELEIYSKEQNKTYSFNSSEIEYIQSQDNYIKVVTNSNQNDILIRTTLSSATTQIASKCTHIFRCHNSFIVNMEKVIQVEGNSAGYKLYLKDQKIPVSRKYVPIIRSYFK